MTLKTNAFLAGLRAGRPQLGLWVSLCSPFAAEAVAGSGFDWMLLDMEHSPNDLTTVMGQLQVLESYPTTAIVRPDWNDAVLVKRLLDLGAPGLLFPMIQTVAEGQAAVASTRYPPRGIRGVSTMTRANHFGRTPDYFARIEDETAVLLQVETRAALAVAEGIGAIDGCSGVFFGPSDIAADMGLLGQGLHPDVWAAILPVAKRLMAAGVPVGTLVTDVGFAHNLLDQGFNFVAVGTDAGLLARGADNLFKAMQG